MAQTGERKAANTPATGKTAATPTAPTTGERKSLLSWLTPRTPSGTAGQPARPQSGFGKLFMGWIILLIALEVVTVGLQYADIAWFHLALEKPWFPQEKNTLLIGGLNSFVAINLVVIVGAYYLLVRLKILPRDLFNPRSRAAAQTPTQNQPGKAAPDGLGKASTRTRASRRHATSTKAATPAPSARRVAAKARVETPTPAATEPTSHDDEYYRVKAAQRQRRRREAKR